MQVTRQDVHRATDERIDPWAVSNGLLYRLCQRYPDHQDARGVTAKMLLIGRAYAAAAERGRSGGSKAESSGDEFYGRDLPQALRRSAVDLALGPLRGVRTITEQNAAQVIEAHSVLLTVLRDLTGLDKRALASKYLHFHLPRLFFIFDSRAERVMRVAAPAPQRNWKRGRRRTDPQYVRFVLRALALRQELERRFGVRLSPRQLDRVLLSLIRAEQEC